MFFESNCDKFNQILFRELTSNPMFALRTMSLTVVAIFDLSFFGLFFCFFSLLNQLLCDKTERSHHYDNKYFASVNAVTSDGSFHTGGFSS